MLATCILLTAQTAAAQQTLTFAVIPPNKDDDIRLYLRGRQTVKGRDALSRMRDDADLVLWLAGN